MAEQNAATVQKFTNHIDDGVGTAYVFPNPFRSTDIVVRQFLVATGEEIFDTPVVDANYIRFYYARIIKPGEINFIIHH